MTIESDVHAAIATVCPRVHTVLAPPRTARPYVTVQNIGGLVNYYVDNVAADKRTVRIYVKSWASSKADALAIGLQIEAAMVAATVFVASVESELLDDVETDVEPWLFSVLQEFLVTGPR